MLLCCAPTLPAAANFPKIFAIDTTNIVKPRARTSPERVLLHQNGHTKFSHQSAAGWKLQFLVQVTGEQTSWVVPLVATMLTPFHNPTMAACEQIRLLCEHVPRVGEEKLVILLDAGYHAPTLTAWISHHNLPVIVVVRLANSLVFYADPDRNMSTIGESNVEKLREKLPKRGRRMVHGAKLSLKNPQIAPDVSIGAPLEKFGHVSVSVWTQMHAKLSGDKLRAVGSVPVVGTVVSVSAQHFTRSGYSAVLHVWMSGNVKVGSMPLFAVLFTYLQRYSVEHMSCLAFGGDGMLVSQVSVSSPWDCPAARCLVTTGGRWCVTASGARLPPVGGALLHLLVAGVCNEAVADHWSALIYEQLAANDGRASTRQREIAGQFFW